MSIPSPIDYIDPQKDFEFDEQDRFRPFSINLTVFAVVL